MARATVGAGASACAADPGGESPNSVTKGGGPEIGAAKATPSRAAFAFIFVTVTLDMLALGIMVPVLPKLVVALEHGDLTRAAAMTGVFGFVWAAMQFVFSPLVGAASDTFGRRRIVLLSNVGMGLDYVAMALAPNLAWLLVGRIVSGITAASFSAASAYIADVTPPERRAARFGMLGAAFGLGFIVGPAVGGVLGQINLRLPFWSAAALSLANAAYGFFILPESLPPGRRAPFDWAKANPMGSLSLVRARAGLLGLTAIAWLDFLAHESLPSIFVLYTDYRYGWSERQVGLVLAAVGVCSTIVSALIVGPAVARLGDRRAILVGVGFGAIGFAFFGAAASGRLFLFGLPCIGLWGIAGPSMQSLMTRSIGPDEQGRLQGALSSLRGIAGMIGPLLFTQVFALGIGGSAKLPLAGAPYLLAMVLLASSLPLTLRVTARKA